MKPADASVVYAIDLGTTYSKCAFIHPERREAVVVPLAVDAIVEPATVEERERFAAIRSAVGLGTDGSRSVAWVGDAARAAMDRPGVRLIEESKGWVGLKPDEEREDSPPWAVPSHRWDYRPEDVGAIVLRRIKQIVDARYPQWPMTRVVITHPQRFEDPRREATRQAGQIAGLDVLGTITEPDAAAISFGLDGGARGTYLVFDLGGGTLDVTVASIDGQRMEPISSKGTHVGGRNYDRKVFELLVAQYEQQVDGFAESYLDEDTRARWMHEAESIKQAICTRVFDGETGVVVRRRLRCATPNFEGELCSLAIDQGSFERATSGLTDECRAIADQALEEANLDWSQLDGVLMVGGSSWNPWIQRMLSSRSGRPVRLDGGLTTAIARGAALHAEQLGRGARPRDAASATTNPKPAPPAYEVKSVLARGLGLLVWNRDAQADVVHPLVRQNARLPMSYERYFRTTADGATTIPLELYEGDSDDPDGCTRIATCEISGLPAGRPAGQRVHVRIDIDTASRKTIAARDEATGIVAQVELGYDEAAVVLPQDVDARRRHILSLDIRGS